MLAAEVMVGHGLQGRVHKRQGFRAIYSNDEQIDCGRSGQGGGKMQMHFFCIFLHIQEPMVFCIFCIFFAFFCICFAFSFLLMSQSMDKFVSRGVANDAAADVDDTPELTDGEGDNDFSLAGNMDTKYRHGLPNATRRITNMLMFNGDIEGAFNPV